MKIYKKKKGNNVVSIGDPSKLLLTKAEYQKQAFSIRSHIYFSRNEKKKIAEI